MGMFDWVLTATLRGIRSDVWRAIAIALSACLNIGDL